MRKVELTLKENYKYKTIKKLVETNGNKERARIREFDTCIRIKLI